MEWEQHEHENMKITLLFHIYILLHSVLLPKTINCPQFTIFDY